MPPEADLGILRISIIAYTRLLQWDACKLVTGTPLLLACVRSNLDVIEYLLDAGADADRRGRGGQWWLSPLTVLKALDHSEGIELLMSAAAGSPYQLPVLVSFRELSC